MFSTSFVNLLLLPCLKINQGYGYEFQDELYDDIYNDISQQNSAIRSVKTPSIISSPVDKTVNEGETIKLPCKVDSLEGFVLVWKKDEKIITIGDNVVYHQSDGRFQLETGPEGNQLIIRLVNPADHGLYTCQISSFQPSSLEHRVSVRVQPIIRIDEGNSLLIKAGELLKLGCSVLSGTPEPVLSWRKEVAGGGGRGGGQEIGTGGVLEIKEVTREDGGVYTCSAVNGFNSSPSIQKIDVTILYAPEIVFVARKVRMLNSSLVTELSCSATANPKPSIAILKDTSTVISNTSIVENETVTITYRIHSGESGEYLCIATNSIGVNQNTINVKDDSGDTLSSSANRQPYIKDDSGSRRTLSVDLIYLIFLITFTVY